ncbi:hypothetical protein AJ79_09109 [Helicocarpus griseus UAMH5409]|uniref:Uncharacterized protein n=1 Tax=Helicocarpus griseus UAMH5409 TaxID=1447875 RepID=A0A2B7WMF6_9EURO|nr:hypothetical protein AJ79_09109 [Helicocarpus griseus UAMH5409]
MLYPKNGLSFQAYATNQTFTENNHNIRGNHIKLLQLNLRNTVLVTFLSRRNPCDIKDRLQWNSPREATCAFLQQEGGSFPLSHSRGNMKRSPGTKKLLLAPRSSIIFEHDLIDGATEIQEQFHDFELVGSVAENGTMQRVSPSNGSTTFQQKSNMLTGAFIAVLDSVVIFQSPLALGSAP